MNTYENENGGKSSVLNIAHRKSREIHYALWSRIYWFTKIVMTFVQVRC